MSNSISNFEPVYQRKDLKQDDVAFCQKCKCTWFEQFVVKQFKANHSAVIGQMVPPASDYDFVIIRCVKCSEKYQPNILVTTQDKGTKLYNDFLDQLEKDEPKPVEVEAVKPEPEKKPEKK